MGWTAQEQHEVPYHNVEKNRDKISKTRKDGNNEGTEVWKKVVYCVMDSDAISFQCRFERYRNRFMMLGCLMN